jgi:hypothetical protein
MTVKTVSYSRLFNLGNYEHEKIGVEMEVAEGESIQGVVDQARNYINLIAEPTKRKIAEAEEVVKNPDMYRGVEVKRAQKFLDDIKAMMEKVDTSRLLSTTEERDHSEHGGDRP